MGLRFRRLTLALAGLALVAGGFSAGRSRASGVPTSGALTYSGTLEGPDGSAMAGAEIRIQLWAAGSAEAPLCLADDQENVRWQDQSFSVVLPEACVDAVHDNPDIEVEVLVGAERESLGRAKLGAVPYALEAARASAAAGVLEARIAALESRVQTPSAFKATKVAQQLIDGPAAEALPVVSFEVEQFDFGGEFEADAFTPSAGGIYHLSCAIYFINAGGGANSLSGWFSVSIRRPSPTSPLGEELARDGFFGDGWTAYRQTSTIARLEPGVPVTCHANHQATSTGMPLTIGGTDFGGSSTFEAYRLSELSEAP